MSSESAAAENLLELLADWVGNCDLWDRHHCKCVDNSYRGHSAEQDVHDDLTKNYNLPLMKKCDDLGFEYVDLMQMIPPAFRTNSYTRKQMLDGITKWARKEYDL